MCVCVFLRVVITIDNDNDDKSVYFSKQECVFSSSVGSLVVLLGWWAFTVWALFRGTLPPFCKNGVFWSCCCWCVLPLAKMENIYSTNGGGGRYGSSRVCVCCLDSCQQVWVSLSLSQIIHVNVYSMLLLLLWLLFFPSVCALPLNQSIIHVKILHIVVIVVVVVVVQLG